MNKTNPKIVVMDISAQEPVLSTMITKEPRWVETFRNRKLRTLGLTKYLDIIFQTELGLDINSVTAYSYWKWLDHQFYDDMRTLVEFNSLIDRYREGSESEEVVVSEINQMLDLYYQFKSSEEKGVS